MPFLGTARILPKSTPISNFGAFFTVPPQAEKMAPKLEISLDFGRI